ncbi:MAG: hypothetical protein V1715_14595 [bacterium]
MSRQLFIFALIFTIIASVGCSSKDTEKLAETQKKLATVISLEKDLMPVFKRSCGVCHNRQNQNSSATEHSVYYENIDDITNKIGKFIISGNPDESGLYKICEQSYPLSDEKIVMPPPGSGIPKWTDQELEKFAKWIAAGALKN